MSLICIEQPTVEPLSIDEVYRHLRLDTLNGEPTPNAPTVALAGLGTGNVDAGIHRYRCTFVTADGETDGGTVGAPITVVDRTTNGQVRVSNVQCGGEFVIARNIYRTLANGQLYLFVATLNDNTSTIFVDNIADATLGVSVPDVNTTSDPELLRLMLAARQGTEEYLNRPLLLQKWRLQQDAFPCDDVLILSKPRLLAVTRFQYRALNGTYYDVDPTTWEVDTDHFPGRIIRVWNKLWPITLYPRNACVVEFTCGYGTIPSAVPEPIKQGMKLLISDMYENREWVAVGNVINKLPALSRLLGPYRHMENS